MGSLAEERLSELGGAADAAELDTLLALSASDRRLLTATLARRYPRARLGQRKRLELALGAAPRGPASVCAREEGVPLGLRLAWLRADPALLAVPAAPALLVDDDADVAHRRRAADAAAMLPGCALVSRHCFALRRGATSELVGWAELLLVRASCAPIIELNACRVCWGEAHGDTLRAEAAAAAAADAVVTGGMGAAAALPLGELLHHPCACRGSGGSVHEGCLVSFLCATVEHTRLRTLHELRCPTCRQPFVGRASALLARCAAAARAARAAEDEALAAAATDGAQPDLAEDAAIAAAEGRLNEAAALWKGGAFAEAVRRFEETLGALGALGAPRSALGALRRAVLQHSAEHNLGLCLKEHGALDEAQPLCAAALVGFEECLGRGHPKALHAMHSVGLLAAAYGAHADAAHAFGAALAGRRAALGDDHVDTLRSAIAHGGALTDDGRPAEAEAVLREAAERCARLLGGESPMALHAAHALALALAALGQRHEAIDALRRVHGARVVVLGGRHKDSLAAASDLAAQLGRWAATRREARSLLLHALDAETATLGADAAQTIRTRERLAVVERLLAAGAEDVDDDGGLAADAGRLVAVLAHVYVAPAHRRRGTARTALRVLIERAWSLGATAVEALVPDADGEAASGLLRAAGFVSEADGAGAGEEDELAMTAPHQAGIAKQSHSRFYLNGKGSDEGRLRDTLE